MGKQSDERFVRRHQGDPAGFVRGIEQQAFARPRRDHRDDGCLFWLVALTAPFVLLASLFRRCRR